MFSHTANAAPARSASASSPAREFLGKSLVYCVISQRAGGLSIGVNMNPDGLCNFDCVYCEVDREKCHGGGNVDVALMRTELDQMLGLAMSGRLRELQPFRATPADLLQLKEVALSGDGEPTLCPNFREVIEAVAHVRAAGTWPFFKIVLITNATGVDLPQVRAGIEILTSHDEIWAKLDAGTQQSMNLVNRGNVRIETVLENIVKLGQKRPIVIQSLFPLMRGAEPAVEEIDAYLGRLRELWDGGAKIDYVQVYSAHRQAIHPGCGHLPLRSLSTIAKRVREETGLRAEVF
jgi:wyosine [tRNA(Phe)-imidazoG37] synthetase (radical SAM superfamily)